MPIGSGSLILDANGRPVPQYYNPSTDQFEAITGDAYRQLVSDDRARYYTPDHSALAFARNVNDAMHVAVDSAPTINVQQYWMWGNTYEVWYTNGAANSMDMREMQQENSFINWQMVRQRWTVT